MHESDSVTHWIDRVKEGDSLAAQALWERYFEKLVGLARRKLQGFPRRIADEEDVALSAFHSFCSAAKKGRFPDLADRDSLWRLLMRMTAWKAVNLIRYNDRDKRRVFGESALQGWDPDAPPAFAQVVGDSPTPEFAAMMADECRRLLELLEDPKLRAIAVAKMEGYKNSEIAKQLSCSVRSVERQLHLIRGRWKQEFDNE